MTKLPTVSRRSFVAGAVAGSTITLLKPSLVSGAAANSVVELGLVG
jgi:hypothetical protein